MRALDDPPNTYYISNMISDAPERLTPPQLHDAAALLAALAHPVRLRIVCGLLDGACCVDPMAECLGLTQPFVSRHLAILREAGVVSCTVEGRKRVYHAVHPSLAALVALLQAPPPEAP